MPRIAVFLILFSLFKGIFLYSAEYLMAFSGQNVVASLRKSVYSHLLDQSMAFFSGRPTGQLMARIISDTERLQETVSRTMTEAARQLVLLLAFLGIVVYIDWRLSLLAFLVAPVVLFLTLQLGKRVRRISWASQEKISDLSNALQETITGQRIVKAFGMEGYERSRFESLVDGLVGPQPQADSHQRDQFSANGVPGLPSFCAVSPVRQSAGREWCFGGRLRRLCGGPFQTLRARPQALQDAPPL